MSDWFKFYETDLSEARLQWAIGKNGLVLSTWIALLTEACRHKGAVLHAYEAPCEIEGFSRLVSMTPDQFNECLALLEEIGYIERDSERRVVLKAWEKRQSTYMTRKARGQIPVAHKPKKEKRKVEPKPKLTDDQWIEAMKKAYPEVNIDREIERAKAWCLTHARVASRQFLVNWFNRSEKPIANRASDPKGF